MSKKSAATILLSAAAMLAVSSQTSEAFCPAPIVTTPKSLSSPLFAEETKESSTEPDAVFVPPPEEDEDSDFEFAESLGRGSAKVCHIIILFRYLRG
jgi:ABC-type sugar transport system substrate-binding protein